MVITDSFVYIHKPKTGGTFVTDALLHLYNGRWNRLQHARLALLKQVRFANDLGTLVLTADKHGGCNNIPQSVAQRTIVSTIRNPYDYYVSQYEFGWWKRKEWLRHYRKTPGFEAYAADFPNLSFQQFMEWMTMAFNPPPHRVFHDPSALGRNTVEFVQDCFCQPAHVLSQLTPDYIASGAYRQHIFPVRFLFTHNLNRDLHDFLVEQGYPAERVAFILHKQKMLPQGKGRSSKQSWEKYYTPELKALVRRKDWLLFALFPQFEATTENSAVGVGVVNRES